MADLLPGRRDRNSRVPQRSRRMTKTWLAVAAAEKTCAKLSTPKAAEKFDG